MVQAVASIRQQLIAEMRPTPVPSDPSQTQFNRCLATARAHFENKNSCFGIFFECVKQGHGKVILCSNQRNTLFLFFSVFL